MTTDPITLQRIETLHPKIRAEVKEIYQQINSALKGKAMCRFTHTYRSVKEQDQLYAIGRTLPGKIVTHARGGQSYHNYGLAIDICLLLTPDKGKTPTLSYQTQKDFDGDGKADWQEVVAIFKQYGYEWGGDWHFKDPPHFQKTFGRSIKQLQQLMKLGKTLPPQNYFPSLD